MANKRPMQRTLEYYRDKGYSIDVVERWKGQFRSDFMGVIDAIAFKPGDTKLIGIQVFGADWAEHRRKIIDEQHEGAKLWLSNKHTDLIFIGWRKLKHKRGGKLMVFKPRFGTVKLTKKRKLKLKEN